MIDWGKKGMRPNWAGVAPLGIVVKYYWQRWDSISLIHGILCYAWEPGGRKTIISCIIVPAQLKSFVMKQLHNSVTGGHLGVKKTLSKVKDRYFWYNMNNDVEVWCMKCDVCAAKKAPPRKLKAPLQQYNVGAPFERIAIDVLGPLTRSKRGNKFLLVIGDYFSKWMEAIPIPDQEATTIAKHLVERVVTIFGVPLELHSDQGSNFESQVFQELCKILGIHKTRTTPLRPQSDGMVERCNRTINNMLSAFVASHQRDWDEYVYLLMLAYRSAVHETTGVTPNEMVFGRQVTLPLDLIIGRPDNSTSFDTCSEYVLRLEEKIVEIHEFARNRLKIASDKMKRRYDLQTVSHKFALGDAVWLHNPKRNKGLSSKLQRPWDGPYLIIQILNDVIYRIQKNKRTESRVVHHDRLKPYKGDNIPKL